MGSENQEVQMKQLNNQLFMHEPKSPEERHNSL